MAQTDRIFSERDSAASSFQFDANVARVFDDMISRSVPLYADVQRAIVTLVDEMEDDPVHVVDLGCSTGTSLIHLARSLPNKNLRLTGVDNSPAMLDRCAEKLEALQLKADIETVCCGIEEYQLQHASVVLLNYTLQFIAPDLRGELLKTIAAGIRPGGILLMSEKVVHHRDELDISFTNLYFDFKRRHGYSEMEIARKRQALEKILVPLTVEQNRELLEQSGFKRVELVLKWFNFATFLAYV